MMISVLIEFLAACYQQGDANGVVAAARTLLSVIPDDLVALQFMALALLQMGQKDKAMSLFRRAASVSDNNRQAITASVCEHAASISYREATRPEFQLAGGWHLISISLDRCGLIRLAERARQASIASRVIVGPGTGRAEAVADASI